MHSGNSLLTGILYFRQTTLPDSMNAKNTYFPTVSLAASPVSMYVGVTYLPLVQRIAKICNCSVLNKR